MAWTIRKGGATDYSALAAVMHDAIHAEPSPYTPQERSAWSPEVRGGPAWQNRLADKTVWLAEDAEGICGFMTLEPEGYVDFAYILARARGTGLFRRLEGAAEAEARRRGWQCLSSHASLAAEPAFAACGWTVREREAVSLNGQRLRRALMEKRLPG